MQGTGSWQKTVGEGSCQSQSLGQLTSTGPHNQRENGSGGEAWESAFLTSTTWDLVALAHPSLPVSMGCGLAERVHVTLGGCRNSIPVHGSYQGVRTTLQQQTNQLKIPCKPREGGFVKETTKKKTKASHRSIQGHSGGHQDWGGTGNLPTAAASCRGVSE